MSFPSKIPQVTHHSNGSELIPSGVPLEVPVESDLGSGYVQDEAGVLNNYSVEPPVTGVKQSRERLILLGLGAIAVLFSLLWIVSSVS
ncbi:MULTISPECIES: hypothetical protein [Synechocystis]|uniref:Ssl1498 family light-harvesting-like protein n=1 Tax=Synechocystis salina LEGE 00031 TaxID=1828736 RepID=A0ABR9VWI9_9SYNC|nr:MULTISPECIES: hypothetical protein [Synechocystis]MBD2654697.1 hypothetical protein [Synechocystis sp. FACHB-383]MBE9197402.1 hypothetical protein [Synechocystis sp. LEGE 06083]MBE9241953.1 hypothetical protein [Synechocystis salina LEGE 00041]MBE9255386.1 hypothetical protein [Synechocystis salina LEGE 00031]